MSKRNPSKPAPLRPTPEQKPAWPSEGHSGEGAASALAVLQRLEKRGGAGRPAEPRTGDEPSP